MDSFPQKMTGPSFAIFFRHWTVIARWPMPCGGSKSTKGLRAEAKIVWPHLYFVAGGVERTAVIHALNVASETGLSRRGVLRALQSLENWGIIRIPDRDRTSGAITVFLEEPLRVANQRLAPGTSYGNQPELGFDPQSCPEEEPQADILGSGAFTPAEPAAFAPAPVSQTGAGDLVSTVADIPPTSATTPWRISPQDPPRSMSISAQARSILQFGSVADIPPRSATPLKSLRQEIKTKDPIARAPQRQDLRGGAADIPPTSATVSTNGDGEIATVGDAVESALRRFPNTSERAIRAAEIENFIRDRVADRALMPGPCRRVAWEIVNGVLEQHLLMTVLDGLDRCQNEGRLKTARWMYFTGAMKRVFAKEGIPWMGKEKAK